MGSLIAVMLGLAERGSEEKAMANITKFWRDLNDDSIIETWTFGLLEGLLFRTGLFSAAPFDKTLAKLAASSPKEFHRQVNVAMSDLNTGIHSINMLILY